MNAAPGSSSPPPRRSPLLALVKARVRVFLREPSALFWVFAFPVLLALALGTAFRDRPPEPVRVGIATDRADASRLETMLSGAAATITLEKLPTAELVKKLDKGAVDVVVTLEPPDGAKPAVHYRFDPQRAEARLARLAVDAQVQQAFGRTDAATIVEATDMPRGARYIDFLLPGLIAMNLMGSALWGVGYGMVQERSRKLMRRFATTPLSRTQFIASYILSRLLFLGVEVGFLVGFGALVFDVHIQGGVLAFIVVALLGVSSFTGLAVLCASRTGSVEVVSGFINALTLPMWLLSGTFFSYERFPEAIQPLIQALPLTALNDALRAIANDGAGLIDVLPKLAVLLGWGLIAFLVGVRLFRWR